MGKRWTFILVATLALGACAGLMTIRDETPPVTERVVTATEAMPAMTAQVALGKRLAEGIMACGSCHTSGNFVGDPQMDGILAGDLWAGQPWGRIGVPNITPDVETGIGGWTDEELARAITQGYSRDGRALVPYMPWAYYGAAITTEETAAVIAYLRSIPEAVSHKAPATELAMPFSDLQAKGVFHNMLNSAPSITEYSADTGTPEGRGKRLAYLGACAACHAFAPEYPKKPPQLGEPMAGGIYFRGPGGELILCANLTPDVETGIGGFSDQQLRDALKFGKRLRPRPAAEMVRWPMMQRITHHTSLTDDEINDLIAYFRAQPAISHDVIAKETALREK